MEKVICGGRIDIECYGDSAINGGFKMKKPIDKLLLCACLGVFLFGCSDGTMEQNPVLEGSKPPKVELKIGSNTYDTVLGSYCWPASDNSHTCIETSGPIGLLEASEKIEVSRGETIEIVLDFKPLPNEVHVTQMQESEETEKSVEFNNSRIIAPEEKGTYYYAFTVWWMDDEDPNVSHGDAFYAFSLEVK